MEGDKEMAKNYRAELTGVFGDPVDDNPTGVVEEAAFRAKNLNYRYLTIKVLPDDLEAAMTSVRVLGMKGINLTMPHKVKVLPYLDELSEAAGIIGAVNTVIHRAGKLYGENTDGKGFVTALKRAGTSLKGRRITILGAGGAARAIAVECALNEAQHITVINRNKQRGRELVELLNEKTECPAEFLVWEKGMKLPEDTEILINGTSAGFSPNITEKPEIDYDSVTENMCVCDVVFNPAETVFLQEGAKRGAKTVSGLGMLVQQAALNFTLWTGEEAPVDVMEEALRGELGTFTGMISTSD